MPYYTTPDNCKLYYTAHNFEPSKPLVVFLNGTSQTTIYWEPHVKAFSEHFGVLRYDARSQGQSDMGKRQISADIHIRDLQDLLNHLNAQQTHLIGISHGAYIALRLAAVMPRLVNRLVLCSIGKDSQEHVKRVVKSWLEILQNTDLNTMARTALPLIFGKRFLNHNKDILDKIVAAIEARNKKEALIAHLKAISDYPSPEIFLKTIQCPTLVISGSDDPMVSQAEARQLAKECRGHHEIFPETGHSIPAEAPALFQQVVFRFLNPK